MNVKEVTDESITIEGGEQLDKDSTLLLRSDLWTKDRCNLLELDFKDTNCDVIKQVHSGVLHLKNVVNYLSVYLFLHVSCEN